MTTILQAEYRLTLLSIREEILQSLGHPVLSVLGSQAARNLVSRMHGWSAGDRASGASAGALRAYRSFSGPAWGSHRGALGPP
jgi:hypothetical protein